MAIELFSKPVKRLDYLFLDFAIVNHYPLQGTVECV